MSKPTFEQRCLIAEQCLPDAPYRDMLKKLHTEMLEALAEQPARQPEQEPMAWMYTGIKQDGTTHGQHLVWKPEYMDAMSAEKGANATPLYTAPPAQRKPLTDEEIDNATRKQVDALLDHIYEFGTAAEGIDFRVRSIARAIEAAHGIKGDA